MLLLLALCPLLACKGQEERLSTAAPAAATEAVAPFNLEIDFYGLTAFVDEGSDVKALLVDADYDPANPAVGDLPPGVKPPPGVPVKDWLELHFPPHRARLRFHNAKVVSGPSGFDVSADFVLPKNSEARFVTSATGPPTTNLGTLATATQVISARAVKPTGQAAIQALDELDPTLTATDPRLSATVLIDQGEVTARPTPECGQRKFTFRLPSELMGVPGAAANDVELAEEVIVKQAGLTGQVEVDLGAAAGPLVVGPADSSQPLVIQVLNQTDEALAEPYQPGGSCGHDTHFETFRWFYSLAPSAARTSNPPYYFPALRTGEFGGDKCPIKGMRAASR